MCHQALMPHLLATSFYSGLRLAGSVELETQYFQEILLADSYNYLAAKVYM